ncbi:MAG: hypothetical protein K5664_00290 [Firmicutes bacterium]|nr:hypothetical protein [Bacillota bacterium]
MSNSRQPDIKYNKSGYADKTAYEAMKNIQKEERKQLITKLKELAKKYGYRIVGEIELKEVDGNG